MKQNLVWIDLEFSGLEPKTDVILEIATIITDSQLNIIGEGPNLAINHPQKILDEMDEWNSTHHAKSGLVERVQKSKESHETAENKTLDFVKEHCKENHSPLCGNSIHQDRRYLYKYMPKLSKFLHYRNIDVSTVKELGKRWYSDIPAMKKKGGHRALADIKESIEELKYYRDLIFKTKGKK